MYRENHEFLTTGDLIRTIGVSAVMGVDGVVLWNDYPSVQNATMCQKNKKFISKSLGPVVKTLSVYLEVCSASLCSSNGRCILKSAFFDEFRKHWNLDILNYHIAIRFFGYHGHYGYTTWYCHCYQGFKGKDCSIPQSYQFGKSALDWHFLVQTQ